MPLSPCTGARRRINAPCSAFGSIKTRSVLTHWFKTVCEKQTCRKRLQSGWSSAAITAVSCSPAASSTACAVPQVRCRSSSSAKAPHGTITLSPSAPPPSFFSASLPSIAASADAVVAGAEARWGSRQGFKGQRRLMHRLAEAAGHRPADAALACHGWC
jgi:hypothetical protein